VRASFFAAIVGGLAVAVACCAQDVEVDAPPARKSHPWARFRPGSWKKVSLITETFDADGKLINTSVARTRTTLSDVDDAGVTLKVEATVDLAGKQVQSEPQVMLQGWHGETPERETTVTDLGEDSVTISGKCIPCHVEQAESITAGGRIVTKTWLSERVSPYVLRRESTTYDRDNDEVVSQTQVEVVALSRAIRLLRRHRQAAELRVVHTHPGGIIRTTLLSSLEVPGGVVSHESEEFNADGRLARRSKLKLVGFAGEFQPTTLR
jgi:ketosteroid isomerase-like protein